MFTYKKSKTLSTFGAYDVFFDGDYLGVVYKNPAWNSRAITGICVAVDRDTREAAAIALLDYATAPTAVTA